MASDPVQGCHHTTDAPSLGTFGILLNPCDGWYRHEEMSPPIRNKMTCRALKRKPSDTFQRREKQRNTIMPIFSSDSNGYNVPSQKFFSRQKSIYSILGRGKVADIVLWRKKNLSAGILLGCTFIWFLFQVLDYTFITLLCRSIIFIMIGLFLWSNGAGFVNCPPPRLPDIGLSESTFRKIFIKIRLFTEIFYDITQGRDMRLFVVIILSLWIFSVLGKYFSTLNILYIGFLCLETMPALYVKYKDEIDYLASRVSRDARKMFKKLNSRVLYKIPRGNVKERRIY